MKKTYILFLIAIICLLTARNSIQEYTGTKITKITYTTIDYHGGYTVQHELDFDENKCATVFYDLCGQAIVGRLPDYYISPPDISYSFHYTAGATSVNTNDIASVVRADYKWNKGESFNNNYYLLNEANRDKNEFDNI